MSSGFMMSFSQNQENGLSSAVTASDMSDDQPTSISKEELSVFQKPKLSFKMPEDIETLSSEEQDKTAQTIPDAVLYQDVCFLEFDKTSKNHFIRCNEDRTDHIGFKVFSK